MGLCPIQLVAWIDLKCPSAGAIGWWAGTGTNKVEGWPQNGTCQQQCPHNRTSSPKCLPPVSVSLGWFPVAFFLSGWLSKISKWVWFRFLSNCYFCPGVLKCVRFCVCSLKVESLFPKALWNQAPNVLWGHHFQCRTPRQESLMWGLDLLFLGENICNCNYPQGSPTWGFESWLFCVSASPLHLLSISLWFLLYMFSCRRSFLLDSNLSHQLATL